MTHKLNIDALTEPLTKVDIEVYKHSTVRKKNSVLILLLSLTAFFAVIWMMAVMLQGSGSTVPVFFSLTIFGGFFLLFWLTSRHSLRRRAKLYKFALRNGLSLIIDSPNPTYSGMIFDNGHSRQIDDAFRFKDGTEIGNYTYTTGSGKSQQVHRWSYVKVGLTRRLPHMILDAKSNNFWKFSNLSEAFDRSQVLSLEGDFNNYFTLYAPKQYERDALYVFTPDVMAAMVDYGKNYDIEIVDDSLFIYSMGHFALDSPDFYMSIMAIIDAISKEVIDQTDYYADERVGSRAVNMIAPEGQRLKSGFNWLIVVIIVIIIYFNVIQPFLFR